MKKIAGFWILRGIFMKKGVLSTPLRTIVYGTCLARDKSPSTPPKVPKSWDAGSKAFLAPPPVLEESYPKTYTVRNLKQKRAISGPAAALRG